MNTNGLKIRKKQKIIIEVPSGVQKTLLIIWFSAFLFFRALLD